MGPAELFERQCRDEIVLQGNSLELQQLSRLWFDAANAMKYSYHFRAFGRPIVQYPQDMIAIQELIWEVKPDLIIETGIAHGGSLIMSAGILALIDYAEAVEGSGVLDTRSSGRQVLGIDIDIRSHNRVAIDAHPFRHKIEMLEGSSIDPKIVETVHLRAAGRKKVFVILDSNHTHEHVLAELEAYAPLTTRGSYCVVFDTVIEDLPADSFGDRPWSVGNNPKTAVQSFLRLLESDQRKGADDAPLRFEIDRAIENKLLLTVAPNGYLKRVS